MYEPREEEDIILYQDDNEECYIQIGEDAYELDGPLWELFLNLFMERDYYKDLSRGQITMQ